MAHRRERVFQDAVRKASTVLAKSLSSAGDSSSSNIGGGSAISGHNHDSSAATAPTAALMHDAAVSSAAKSARRVSTQFQRAYALQRLHQFEAAVRDYDICAAREPTHALVFYNRGCAQYALGRLEAAVQDFSKAIKLEAKSALYIESRAVVLKELGRFREAIRDYAWLEALRRAASKSAGGSATSDSKDTGRRRAQPVDSHLHHGSFSGSASCGDVFGLSSSLSSSSSSSSLEPSALSPPSPPSPDAPLLLRGSDQRTRNKNKNKTNSELTINSSTSNACEWFVRFLKLKPVARTASDVRAAVALGKTWSFFRGMALEMVEQCLEEATYGHFEADQVVVDQGARPQAFHVVLNAVASLVKNVDVRGVSTARELTTLCHGDAVGVEPFATSFADGTLRTLQHMAAGTTTSPRTGLIPGLEPVDTDESASASASDADDSAALLPLEPASFACLDDDVHCLVLRTDVYQSLLREHECVELDERLQFLRACRVFASVAEDVLTALAVRSSRRVYDPGTDVLRTGDVVTHLFVIKRGVCHVRKTVALTKASLASVASVPTTTSTATGATCRVRSQSPAISSTMSSAMSSGAGDESLTARSTADGSWVLDNGWMLTNPRLVANAQPTGACSASVPQAVTVAVLASGQVFGELSVLQPGQASPVSVQTQTLVEVLVFHERDLARVHVQFQSGTMNALQDSLLFHNPPTQKIAQLHRERDAWSKHKRSVLDALFSRTGDTGSLASAGTTATITSRCSSNSGSDRSSSSTSSNCSNSSDSRRSASHVRRTAPRPSPSPSPTVSASSRSRPYERAPHVQLSPLKKTL